MIVDETFEYNRPKPVRAGLVTADCWPKRKGLTSSQSGLSRVIQDGGG